MGTTNVCNFARSYGARVLFTSTDKAAYPVNTYGMSKALAERAVMDASTSSVVVRYGNVLGSRGSFLPELVKSLKTKGEANLTNYQMTRFWMTADTVAHFVFNTGMSGLTGLVTPGEIKSSYVRELIGAVARIIGVTDYKVNLVGVRPGEKFHECLTTEFEGGKVESNDANMLMDPTELSDLIRPIVRDIEVDLLETK
jgi:FlaA1/EpsC-like NDP-sugar epimerase